VAAKRRVRVRVAWCKAQDIIREHVTTPARSRITDTFTARPQVSSARRRSKAARSSRRTNSHLQSPHVTVC